MKSFSNLVLTLTLSAILCAGCSDAGNNLESDVSQGSVSSETVKPQEKILSSEELESLSVNELGEVMVLMYHNVGCPEATWRRTPENFERDLEELYSRGFRAIRLSDYANGNIDVNAGFTPVVITFDDGNENNFRYIEDGDGKLEIDPQCAVGILEKFKQAHPDFNATATFFINSNPFGNQDQAGEKLRFLVENGYDIGNHTLNHADLSKADFQEIQKQLAGITALVKGYVPEYRVNTLALPFGGVASEENMDAVKSGSYDNSQYENICVLRVGWDPYKSPFHKDFDRYAVHRVRASETNVDNVGLYDWLGRYESGEKTRYISDGNPSTVAVPEEYSQNLNDQGLEKQVIKY